MYGIFSHLKPIHFLSQVVQHRGNSESVMRRYRSWLTQGFPTQSIESVESNRVDLFAIATDERMLNYADKRMIAEDRFVPSNSRKLEEYRGLRVELRSGKYAPEPTHRCRIPKPGNRGERTLEIPAPQDRVIQRSFLNVLQPILDRHFFKFSFGFRPGRGVLQALATALEIAKKEERVHWVCVDIRDAFHNIPQKRLLQILAARGFSEWIQLAASWCFRAGQRGIIQGSPLSPLLLNVYLDHFLDQPWQRQTLALPLIRYADDRASGNVHGR